MMMSSSAFYRGLLYALCEASPGGKFVADGDEFHNAFREALRLAVAELPDAPAKQMLRNFDPVFGVSPEASEMLLEGERDLILSLLNPKLRVAEFKIDAATAKKALDRLPNPEALRKVAKHFRQHLPS